METPGGLSHVLVVQGEGDEVVPPEHGRIVCKPLHGMGGRSIFVLSQGDKNARVVFESMTEYGEHYAMVGVTVGCSLIGVVLWGSLSGSMLPIMLRRLGLDPASACAPFVATLVDVTGLVIYFTFASIFLASQLAH